MATTHYCPRCLNTFTGDPDACTNLACGRTRPPDGWGDLLHPGDVLDRHYVIERALAVGGAGLTYLAREVGPAGEPAGPKLAIKVLYQQRDKGDFLRRLANEAQILQELAHSHIVECRGFVHRTGHAPYLVTLFEHGGSLGAHLETHGPLSPRVSAGILRQVLLALDTAHQRAIVHRDLKPENVLLRARVHKDEIPDVRVADFGIAKVAAIGDKLTRAGAFIGTPEFAAPEQFDGLAPTPATDVFAAGALLYALLTDEAVVAFDNRLDSVACRDELERAVPPTVPGHVGTDAERELLQRLLDGMMQVLPDRRWTVQQALVALNGLVEGTPRKTLQTLDVTATPDDSNTVWVPGMEDEAGTSVPRTRPAPTGEDEEPARSGDWTGTLLGVGAPVVTLLVGLPLAAIVLLATAWATGWYGSAPRLSDATVQEPISVSVPEALPPVRNLSTPANPEEQAERDRLANALGQQAAAVQKTCHLGDALVADVRISDRGRVRSVDVQTELPEDVRRCVIRELRRSRLARTSTDDVSMRITVSFSR